MAKYSDIKGFTVQTLSTDTVANQGAGGSWASGGAMNTARDYVGGAAADKDAALIFGGSVYRVEQYDGSSWTEKTEMNCPNDVNYSRSSMGTYTACIAAGGSSGYSNLVEQWDGSSWTEIAELNEGRGFGSASPIGTVTAGLVAAAFKANPGVVTANTETWNGSTWTEVNEMNTGRGYAAGLGTSTSAMIANGQVPPSLTLSNTVETWDGSSWTETTEVNTARARGVAAGESSTSALFYSGATGSSTGKAETEFWDGSSWTEVADLSTARMRGGGGGTAATAIMAAGRHPAPATAATEEWSAPATFNQIQEGQLFFNSTANAFKETITDIPNATWASSTSLNTPRGSASSWGTATSSVAAGGNAAPEQRLKVETWNGSTWTETTNLSNSRTQNAGLGNSNSDGYVVGNESSPNLLVEQWNGSSWTEVNDINNPHSGAGVSGTSTSGIVFGGEPNSANAETWNGSSWTETSNLNTGRAKGIAFGGSSSDALLASGFNSPPTSYKKNTEIWDGTSWTEVNDMNDFHQSGTSGGTSSVNGIGAGGDAQQPPGASRTVNTEFWNGSSWTEVNNMGTARMDFNFGFVGSSSSTLAIGGNISTGDVATVEEWTADLANKTITAS